MNPSRQNSMAEGLGIQGGSEKKNEAIENSVQ